MAEPSAHITGIILAAGLATRFGGHKLLSPLWGRPLFSHVLEAALESRLDQVIMVCSPELAAAVPSHDKLHCLLNPEPQAGQSGSLRLGLTAAPADSSHLLFMLADQPLITPESIARFLALAQKGAGLACLGWEQYLGPPTLVGREYFSELRSLSGDRGAGGLLRKHRERLQVVPADHEPFTWDVDRPSDLARLEKLRS